MKIIFFSLLVSFNIFARDLCVPKIAAYEFRHKDAVLAITFEDALKFFCGSATVTRRFMTEEQFLESNKTEMDKILTNSHAIIEVLLVEDKVVGFVEFNKTREQSIESLIKMIADQGMPAVTAEQLEAAMPQLKKLMQNAKITH